MLLVGIAIWLKKLVKKHRETKRKKKCFRRNGGHLLEKQMIARDGSVESTTLFNSKELSKATEGFSSDRILGQGGQGAVFKGMLKDGRIVAVKKSKAVDEDQVEQFINEIVILSQINHRNIVKILGCCLETDVPLLVYEFVPNGNLLELLHNDLETITWGVRLRIAIDIAGSLSYLHSAAASPVYHKDIKSSNVMLDEAYSAKLADFGISRMIDVDRSHLTTVVSGTVGYICPEFFQSGRYTEKCDVYSFGVILVELITGKKPVTLEPSSQGNMNLATLFLHAMKEKSLFHIIDPRIRNDCNLEHVTLMANIAKLCLNLKGEKRPSMKTVAIDLECIHTTTTEKNKQKLDVASTSTSQYLL